VVSRAGAEESKSSRAGAEERDLGFGVSRHDEMSKAEKEIR